MSVEKRGYNIEEAAAWLGSSVSTVRDLIKDRQIASKRLGAKHIINVDELERFFASLPEERQKKDEAA